MPDIVATFLIPLPALVIVGVGLFLAIRHARLHPSGEQS